jgi:FtsZ-interacting cell division protein ZipA
MPPQGFFPTEFKDWVIIVGTIATVIGLFFAGWKGLAEWNRSTKQREEELKQRELEFRHKQAVYARRTKCQFRA